MWLNRTTITSHGTSQVRDRTAQALGCDFVWRLTAFVMIASGLTGLLAHPCAGTATGKQHHHSGHRTATASTAQTPNSSLEGDQGDFRARKGSVYLGFGGGESEVDDNTVPTRL